MEKITRILDKKQHHFLTIGPNATAANALNKMCCENVEYLVVMDDHNEHYVGLISEHDITSRVVFANKLLAKTNVTDVMNNRLPVATADDTVEKCMQMMRRHHVRYLPVFENFHFKGIVSSEDILDEAVYNRQEIFDTSIDSPFALG